MSFNSQLNENINEILLKLKDETRRWKNVCEKMREKFKFQAQNQSQLETKQNEEINDLKIKINEAREKRDSLHKQLDNQKQINLSKKGNEIEELTNKGRELELQELY
ncbi:hypothetical protein M0811_04249 [Anaeramoeba ignava]|uniref:Uncharacterized protein n=1 Tax=Anaeramoeba ignava TaxID=1746090 RepID=A0A9Q0RGY1_ANAIG|nr:hypothetical protein M0811_04249 [Anaeramoeba ignava]